METCVAYDYGPGGYCYAYKQDPAGYIGNGEVDWSCYTQISIPEDCESVYHDSVNLLQLVYFTVLPQVGQLQSENSDLTSSN
jgi:hypothetical protein